MNRINLIKCTNVALAANGGNMWRFFYAIYYVLGTLFFNFLGRDFFNFNYMSEINFYNIDNIEFMKSKPDNCYDLAIVDIPYGLGDKLTNGGTWASKYKKGDADWDKLPPPEYWEQLFRVSKNQIIWGGNYVELPPNRCFIIWDKVALMPTMADSEYAWTSFDRNAKTFRHVRNTSEKRIHITQKPIKLYRWILQTFAASGYKILDTHGGSGSIAIACHDEKFDLDICEINKNFYDDSKKRFDYHKRQLQLF